MNPSHTTHLKAYNPDASCNELTGESLDVYSLAKSLTLENFAALLEDYLNLGSKGYREGCEIGLQLRFTHCTLQHLVICFAQGLIADLSEQEFADPRNETAILTAKRL